MANFEGSNKRRPLSKHESTRNYSTKRDIQSCNPRKARNDKQRYSSDHMQRKHISHLRRITDTLLREQIMASALVDYSSPNDIKNCNEAGNQIEHVQSKSQHDNRNGRAPIQTLQPWVESSSADVDNGQQSESMTEHTALCSAFEMISFDNICKKKKSSSPTDNASIEDDFKVVAPLVPREISFERREICRNHNLLREELVIKGRRSNFLKKFLHLRLGRRNRSTSVAKVKVYVDPPKTLGSNSSVGNSTLTWPTEFEKNPPV
mmetsp:Transcript_4003/g.8615  ORF Transcript_4003/g.8615 Transcript_4003/m.8615 type:complete len:263 (+) Transcript_4003:36-824(+)